MGLCNREGFLQVASQELDRACYAEYPVTVTCISFPSEKDPDVDAILQTVAGSLKRSLRRSDVLARWHPRDLVALLPGTGVEAAMAVVHKLQTELDKIMRASDRSPVVNIGAVTYLTPPGSVDTMIHGLERLIRSVRQEGKDRVLHELVP